jgi:hypothetical protein
MAASSSDAADASEAAGSGEPPQTATIMPFTLADEFPSKPKTGINVSTRMMVKRSTTRLFIDIPGATAIPLPAAKRPRLTEDQQKDCENLHIILQRMRAELPDDVLQRLAFPELNRDTFVITNDVTGARVDLHVLKPPTNGLSWISATTTKLLDKGMKKQHTELNYNSCTPCQQSYANHSIDQEHGCSIIAVLLKVGVLARSDLPLCILECKIYQQQWRENMEGDDEVTCSHRECGKTLKKKETSADVVATRQVIMHALKMNKNEGKLSNGPLAIALGVSWKLPMPEIFGPNRTAIMHTCKTCNTNEGKPDHFDAQVLCIAKLLAVTTT